MKVWGGEGDFLTLLKADKDVRKHLSEAELKANFDLAYHFKHVDTIFAACSATPDHDPIQLNRIMAELSLEDHLFRKPVSDFPGSMLKISVC